MRSIRKLLFPLSLIYGLITWIRNKAFDYGWLKSTEFSIPIIAVGNLSVGGTGKSPMIEYLVRLFYESESVAVLSRGYGRNTTGYILADESSKSNQIGDEPYQFLKKFKGLKVAVDEDRVNGVNHLLKINPGPNLILLDDAFQHRKIKAGLYVLMTGYDRLFSEDLLLPAGNLRESAKGADRADMIVISKCPNNLSAKEMMSLQSRLKISQDTPVFFTGIKYDEKVFGPKGTLSFEELKSKEVLLVTGIANPKPLTEFLQNNLIDFKHLKYSDHHNLSSKDFIQIGKELRNLDQDKELILTTEKDYMRSFDNSDLPVYYLPIQMCFLEGENKFKKLINEYVREN